MLRTYVRSRGVASPTAPRCLVCHDLHVSQTVRSRTVLIVDDHPSFRASARAVLEAAGFEIVAEAADGEAAIAAIDRFSPDVVILDIQLPDMSGFDLCAALEELGERRPAIVLVSSRDRDDYGELVSASTARGFVAKDQLTGEAVAALLG